MNYTTDEIRKKIIPIAEKYQLRSVYIFGSYARNEATDISDMDVLVDTTDSKVKGWVIGGLYNDLCETFGGSIDLVTTNALIQDREKDRTPWFTENIMRDRILIYEQQ
jgi:predicted nucleotidyltransferase